LSPRGIHRHFPAWRNYREYSGGQMTDMGAHHYDIVQWALDMDASGPAEIIPPADAKADRGVKFIYPNGVEVIHGGPSGLTIIGTNGMISVDRSHLLAVPDKILKDPLRDGDVHLPEFPGHHRNWLDCIRSRSKPICDVKVGARSVTVCHLGNLAYWNQRRLRWDAQQWQFIGDAEANTWLDRPRREPWSLG
jgi:predicted dehydrogenase